MVLNNPEDRKKILNCIKEISNSMARVEGERTFQKEAVEAAADDTTVEKKYISAMAKMYHKQNFAAVQQEKEELEELYESVVK